MIMELSTGVCTVVETIKGLLATGQFSDMTLFCQDKQFFVHRGIVCSRSPVWAAATEGKFKVRIGYQGGLCVAGLTSTLRKLRRKKLRWT